MPAITIKISDRAEQFLRAKIRTRYGTGMFISELLVREEERERLQEALARHTSALHDAWTETGLESIT